MNLGLFVRMVVCRHPIPPCHANPGFGNEVNSPFPSAVVSAEAASPEIPSPVSFCETSQPGFVVSGLKIADDEKGFIVRGYEATGQDAEVALKFPLKLESVNETSLIEEDLANTYPTTGDKVQLKLGKRSIHAYRVAGRWNPPR